MGLAFGAAAEVFRDCPNCLYGSRGIVLIQPISLKYIQVQFELILM
jgi:hypothetical protein